MKFLVRWKLDGGNLVLLRKLLWWFLEYEHFSSRLNKHQNKLEKLAQDFKKEHEAYVQCLEEEKAIKKSIKGATECKDNYGKTFIQSLSLFKPKKIKGPDTELWKTLASVFRGRSTFAEQVSANMRVVSVDDSYDQRSESREGHSDFPIQLTNPNGNGNNGKKNNQQNNQNN